MREEMWISGKLAEHEMPDMASAQCGTVTVDGAETAVFSSGERRGAKTASPGGVIWKPRRGGEVLVVRGGAFGEEAYIAGAVGQDEGDLEPGEVRVCSDKAEIVLRNSGRVDINGVVFINGMPLFGIGG